MTRFRYDAALLERFPAIVGGMLLAEGVQNGPTPPALLEQYRAEQAAVSQRLAATALSTIPSLAAWRSAFRGFGVDPTQYRSAAEALLRRLSKGGEIPSINTLVDLGNLISIRYAVPLSVIDLRAIPAGITARFATGDERFTNLGQSEIDHPAPGEVIFSEPTGVVLARRWCWRQSAESAARADTTGVLVVIEGHHASVHDDLIAALRDLTTLLPLTPTGTIQTALLDASSPATPF